MTPPICFADCETTALGPLARPWEIAVIRREPDGAEVEHLWHVEYTYRSLPDGTNPEALAIGGWPDRGAGLDGAVYRADVAEEGVRVAAGAEYAVARQVHEAFAGGPVLVGVGVHFDAAVLSAMFLRHGLDPEPWQYAIFDLKAATWGALAATSRFVDGHLAEHERAALSLPMSSEALSRAVDVEPPSGGERHTALGDARWCRRWFDRLARGAS